jgi:hypothetical protein
MGIDLGGTRHRQRKADSQPVCNREWRFLRLPLASAGTVNIAEVLKVALKQNAAAAILAHPQPTRAPHRDKSDHGVASPRVGP